MSERKTYFTINFPHPSTVNSNRRGCTSLRSFLFRGRSSFGRPSPDSYGGGPWASGKGREGSGW